MYPAVKQRHIALLAHDNIKTELLRWAECNHDSLSQHQLYATGTTGTMLKYELGLPVHGSCPGRPAATCASGPSGTS
ncbi:hypothetical protein [Promicromonospora sp. NFX87]|uniref:hypothetical protein n=1 Tax=Promicromonospora sp. NFX87 TaxID=3402691 RepID=UPI003AFA0ECA